LTVLLYVISLFGFWQPLLKHGCVLFNVEMSIPQDFVFVDGDGGGVGFATAGGSGVSVSKLDMSEDVLVVEEEVASVLREDPEAEVVLVADGKDVFEDIFVTDDVEFVLRIVVERLDVLRIVVERLDVVETRVETELLASADAFRCSTVLTIGVTTGLGVSEDEIVIVSAGGSDVVIPPVISLVPATDELPAPPVDLSTPEVPTGTEDVTVPVSSVDELSIVDESTGVSTLETLEPAGAEVTRASTLETLESACAEVTRALLGGVETSTTALFGGPSTRGYSACACRRWPWRWTFPLPVAAPSVRNPRRYRDIEKCILLRQKTTKE
jgi:hypothetical protein